MTTGALRLTWASEADAAGTGRLKVVLHSAISGRELQTIVDRAGTGADTVFLADEPRVSYLEIQSDHLTWTVTLDELVPGGPQSPSPGPR
ncbi:MAG: hypothetical protein R2712_16600 [Vicinamibacterales bacterium]